MNTKKNIINLTKKLITIPSISSHQEKCLEGLTIIKKTLEEIQHINIEIIVHNGVYSLIAKNFSGIRGDIVLNGHIDVVSAHNNDFVPTLRGNRIYGRGSGDMKGGVALITILFKQIMRQGTNKNIILIITGDEEIGGKDGIGYLTEQGYGGNIVLIPDGGATNKVVIASKGLLNIDIVGNGKGAHASRPWKGDSIFHDFLKIIDTLKSHIETGTKTNTWGTTVSVTKLSFGEYGNTTPSYIKGTIDIRFSEQYTKEDILKDIHKILKNFTHFNITINASGGCIWAHKNQNKYIKKYTQCVTNITGSCKMIKENGSSDGRYFAEKGSTVILHRPTCGNIHSTGEWCSISGIEKIYQCYKDFINLL